MSADVHVTEPIYAVANATTSLFMSVI